MSNIDNKLGAEKKKKFYSTRKFILNLRSERVGFDRRIKKIHRRLIRRIKRGRGGFRGPGCRGKRGRFRY